VTVSVSYSTAAAAIISGNVHVALDSEGLGIDSLGETALGTQDVAVTVTVDNFAVAAFAKTGGSGTLTGSPGAGYTLDFGHVAFNSVAPTVNLEALNAALGPADLLDGSFVLGGGTSHFTNGGLGDFLNLGAGGADTAPVVTLHTDTAGHFTETITLHNLVGHNPEPYSGALADVTLTITGTVAPRRRWRIAIPTTPMSARFCRAQACGPMTPILPATR